MIRLAGKIVRINKVYTVWLTAVLVLCCMGAVYAAEPQEPAIWEDSVQPKKTAQELESERWIQIMQNETGVYLFDHTSVTALKDTEGDRGRPAQQVLTRTVFLAKTTLEKLNERYAAILSEGASVGFCDTLLTIDLEQQRYRILRVQVYTKDGRLIDDQEKKEQEWKPIPSQSFAELLLKVLINRERYSPVE